ncbi:MAG: selenocysteine-specific translation elongation factor [Armatimonadetes bacterium]|nr:selenocysteine-specific translation elongation factor [Armatimonadota bacterium]
MKPEVQTKHLILGTAGHVDHGKTTLVRALTGINTDRLKEEQVRGLTIDLGFAHLKLPSGLVMGIVDVPGHEKFLKNMLAGASGVDIAMLVVAADEGVMPQTREHLEILEILETRLGVVALTKVDMVEHDWLEIVEDDLRGFLKGTFLDNANIIRVSGTTGQGIPDLVAELDRLADAARQRSIEGPFRLPVDRVFTVTGFGTVVTGTLTSGTLRLGDPVSILPQKIDSRVRQIEVHGAKQETVYAGTRVAVNLAGVDVPDMQRGSVVVPPGYLQPTRAIDAAVNVLRDSPRPLTNRARIRLHIGTVEAIGRAIVLGQEEIEPGGKGFVHLRLEQPIVAARGDRFVLRFYSPSHLLGGGVVLDPAGGKRKRGDKALITRLERTLKGEPRDVVEDAMSISEMGLVKKDIPQRTGLTQPQVDAALDELVSEGLVVEVSTQFLHKAALDMISTRVKAALAAYHTIYPMRPGMPKEELRVSLGPRTDQKGFQAVLGKMASDGEVIIAEATVRMPDHQPTLNDRQQQLLDRIDRDYADSACNPPLLPDVEKKYGPETKEIVATLAERGELVRIAPDLLFHRTALEHAEQSITAYLQSQDGITVAQFRDLINSSRKYVVPLLEYLDDKRVTRREGDLRVLYGKRGR